MQCTTTILVIVTQLYMSRFYSKGLKNFMSASVLTDLVKKCTTSKTVKGCVIDMKPTS
jgi:hypothetical protein